MKIESFEELEAYQLAFALQQRIFVETRAWPREEAYSLTDQIRRSSRSVGAIKRSQCFIFVVGGGARLAARMTND